jgi:aspartate kinase
MIVQKFGGTSMGSAESIQKNVAPQIIKAKKNRQKPIVVVSAMSGVTNQILLAANESLVNKHDEVKRLLEIIKERHLSVINEIQDEEIKNCAEQNIMKHIQRLEQLMRGINLVREVTPSTQDKLLALGEKLSANLLAPVLSDLGHPAQSVDLQLQDNEEKLKINGPESLQGIMEYIKGNISSITDHKIPVLTGFFGPVQGGIINSVGRGYSDYCASLVGAAMKADLIENWTDVDGILSADPKLVPHAELLAKMTYDEAAEISDKGAKVIHPFCVEPARKAGINIHVRNTFNPSSTGTVITSTTIETDKNFKTITAKKGVTIVRVKTPRMLDTYGYMEKISEIFNAHKISVDLISTSAVSVSITVDKEPNLLFPLMEELAALGEVNMVNGHSVISIVGSELSESTETISNIMLAFKQLQIPVKMISMGDNGININLVIEDQYLETAVQELHKIR